MAKKLKGGGPSREPEKESAGAEQPEMIQINGKMYPKRPGFEERLERARRLYPMATEGLLESIANGRWSTG